MLLNQSGSHYTHKEGSAKDVNSGVFIHLRAEAKPGLGHQGLDLELRFRVHDLMQALQRRHLSGVIDLTPGTRSLQIHQDLSRLPRDRVLEELGNPSEGGLQLPRQSEAKAQPIDADGYRKSSACATF